MKMVALERFSDPSRRCDPSHVAWDLPHLREVPVECLRRVPGALAGWLTMKGNLGDRRRLFRACLRTRGAQVGALLRAPELLGRVRRGEADTLAAYSTKDFGLAHLLANELDGGCREVIAHGTQYFGEFAFELLAVIPYAYWLHTRGLLERTVSTPYTRPLYTSHPTTRSTRSHAGTCRSPSIPSAAADGSVTTSRRFEGARHTSLAATSLQGGIRRQPVRLGPRAMHHLQQILGRALPLA